MKCLSFFLLSLIAIVSASAQTVTSEPETTDDALPIEQLVALISSQSHWEETNLSAIGLNCLVSETDEDEEAGVFTYFVYGLNTRVAEKDGWTVALEATGEHAFAIEVTLMTDNGTRLFFAEEADALEFLRCARSSAGYELFGENEILGTSLLEGYKHEGDWWVLDLHVG